MSLSWIRAAAVTASMVCGVSIAANAESKAAGVKEEAGVTAVHPSKHTVIELRQYTLHPGKRDVLIDIFERNFVEGQEEQGMRILGQFRDRDNPDRFVWLRSFADMPARATALNGFYFGPVWQSHRGDANPTMVDSDNVLLLRPASPGSGLPITNEPLAARDAQGPGKGLVILSIVYLRRTTPGSFVEFFDKELKPEWIKHGGCVVGELVTETSANNFPRLPVREGENVFVWLDTYADQKAYENHHRALAQSADWRELSGRLSLWTHQPIEVLRLEPTARSRLHGP
jgi:quinol monooxygenase YgiN